MADDEIRPNENIDYLLQEVANARILPDYNGQLFRESINTGLNKLKRQYQKEKKKSHLQIVQRFQEEVKEKMPKNYKIQNQHLVALRAIFSYLQNNKDKLTKKQMEFVDQMFFPIFQMGD